MCRRIHSAAYERRIKTHNTSHLDNPRQTHTHTHIQAYHSPPPLIFMTIISINRRAFPELMGRTRRFCHRLAGQGLIEVDSPDHDTKWLSNGTYFHQWCVNVMAAGANGEPLHPNTTPPQKKNPHTRSQAGGAERPRPGLFGYWV